MEKRVCVYDLKGRLGKAELGEEENLKRRISRDRSAVRDCSLNC